jgi:hypothetical protein
MKRPEVIADLAAENAWSINWFSGGNELDRHADGVDERRARASSSSRLCIKQ